MSMDYVRRHYGVPVKRGGRVRLGAGFGPDAGREGTITSASYHVFVRLDGERHVRRFHPTWELDYIDTTEAAA